MYCKENNRSVNMYTLLSHRLKIKSKFKKICVFKNNDSLKYVLRKNEEKLKSIFESNLLKWHHLKTKGEKRYFSFWRAEQLPLWLSPLKHIVMVLEMSGSNPNVCRKVNSVCRFYMRMSFFFP